MNEREAVLGRLWDLSLLLSEDTERGLADRGLTRSRAHVVWELHRRGPVTQRVLSEALQVSARNITGLIDALAATGFVTREPHPADRRATMITLTETGAAAAAAMDTEQKAFADALFDDIAPADLTAFTTTLDQLLARLRALTSQADTPRDLA